MFPDSDTGKNSSGLNTENDSTGISEVRPKDLSLILLISVFGSSNLHLLSKSV